MKARQSSLSLKTRIAAAVLLLFLAAIWLLTYLTTTRLQTDLVDLLESQQFAHVSHVAVEVRQKVDARFEALEAVAAEITPAMLANPVRLHALLEARPLLLSLFAPGVVVVSRDGKRLADNPREPQRAASPFAEREYFAEVMAGKARVLGQPRQGRVTGKLGVAFSVPVYGADRQVAAVLVGFATLADPGLFGGIQNARVGKSGWIAVSDARYRVIVAINDPKRILQPFPAPGVNVMLDRFAAGYEGSGVSVNSQGREVLSSARMVGDTGWFVQAVLPTAEAFEPIRDLQERAYVYAAILSLLVALAVWLVIRVCLAPLAAATRAVRAMSSGREEFHDLPVGRRDEIGELLAGFNKLLACRQELELALERQAMTDILTGLPNRRMLIEVATKELARVARHGGVVSLLMLDLDHFKQVNDTHGHQAGDLVLRRFAGKARACLREIDTLARFGGEEFVALLPDAGSAEAAEVAERLRRQVETMSVPLKRGVPLRVTVSIGIATLDDPLCNVDTLLSRADQALYAAKRGGRNCVRCAPMPPAGITPRSAETSMTVSMENDR